MQPSPGRLYMDAVITPNRSLSPRGFYVIMILVLVYNIAAAVFLIAIGALPVPIFLLIDVLGLWLAFQLHFRKQGGVAERVQVSAEEIRVLWESRRGARTVWTSPTALTRVAVEKGERDGTRVRLALSQKRFFVAQALSPKERVDFGAALERAVSEARAERW